MIILSASEKSIEMIGQITWKNWQFFDNQLFLLPIDDYGWTYHNVNRDQAVDMLVLNAMQYGWDTEVTRGEG